MLLKSVAGSLLALGLFGTAAFSMLASDTSLAVAVETTIVESTELAPTCCAKHAYCCSQQRRCCGKSTIDTNANL